MRTLLAGTLSACEPDSAVAFVDNHDTQPGQSLESWVRPWFKPHAYAFILLRDLPYPCVFHGDWYGIPHSDYAPRPWLPTLTWIRAHLLGDCLTDYRTDDPHALCWQVHGDHPIVVAMGNGSRFTQAIHDPALAGRRFVDILGAAEPVRVDGDGNGLFTCPEGAAAVFLDEHDAAGLPA